MVTNVGFFLLNIWQSMFNSQLKFLTWNLKNLKGYKASGIEMKYKLVFRL